MTYFKNTELAARYNISESTVRNWIKMSKSGKLGLALVNEKGKTYVANSAGNIPLIEKLVEKNRKYRNSLSLKSITPKREFYKVFDQGHIYDIVRNLELHHELPRQYNYFDGGAEEWNIYANAQIKEKSANLLNRTIELIDENYGYLNRRLAGYKRVNIVDIGVGNALPAKKLVASMLESNQLGRYIAIDISPEMLTIAKSNMKEWFGNRVVFEGYPLDVTFERFANVLAEDYLKKDGNEAVNLVLFLGGTADNLRNPDDVFRTINESMNPNDLLLYTDKLETPEMIPEWFNHDAKPGKLELAKRHRIVFDLLNIDESFYDVDMGLDSENCRFVRTRFKVAVTLKFDFEDGQRIIQFEKGDTIRLWRLWLMQAEDVARQFACNGFYVLHTSQTADREYIMTIAEVERGI